MFRDHPGELGMKAFWRSSIWLLVTAATAAYSSELPFEKSGTEDSDVVYQIVGCTETQIACAVACTGKLAYSSIYAPEACFDWFEKGLYICFCQIPSPD